VVERVGVLGRRWVQRVPMLANAAPAAAGGGVGALVADVFATANAKTPPNNAGRLGTFWVVVAAVAVGPSPERADDRRDAPCTAERPAR